ncbi:hypothetical protein DWB61_05570 [Ancylomarina euxinus]|uniref:Uncharacterized protein n=1 Tax=Ancylomarina euxinus TaxID=2283627 RepID=A0A425Y4E7_9BACT|nr:hypothetical protein DWB61_05570 [Ancylomarina euxinus]
MQTTRVRSNFFIFFNWFKFLDLGHNTILTQFLEGIKSVLFSDQCNLMFLFLVPVSQKQA